jgi:AraC-like DNA-binding protein
MYDQIRSDILFGMLYAVVAVLSLIACCYLLFRQGNAFARDVTPPVRLRRWTAAYFAAAALCHLWYMPIFFLTSSESIMMTDLVGGLLDSMTVFPLAIIVMLNMLQDRRRPLWPIALMIAPFVAGSVFSIATLSYALIPKLYVYLLLLSICIVIYMVRATRQYGRWLRDNYADLEHKEVWQSFVVLAFILLLIVFYAFVSEGLLSQYAMQVIGIVLIGYLLWRVETLSDLSLSDLPLSIRNRSASPLGLSKNIGPLLKKYCEDPQLYLQNDVSLSLLANQIGINRSYLSKHFAMQGISYNEYINGLRIQHFVNLYHEAAATHQPVTVQQLAYQSGFRSYNTFSVAFKKTMGMNTTEWIRDQISS